MIVLGQGMATSPIMRGRTGQALAERALNRIALCPGVPHTSARTLQASRLFASGCAGSSKSTSVVRLQQWASSPSNTGATWGFPTTHARAGRGPFLSHGPAAGGRHPTHARAAWRSYYAPGEPSPDLLLLVAAAEAGDTVEVQRLLQQGVDVNEKNKNERTPLSMAAWKGHLEVVKVLLAAGADMNVDGTSRYSRSPLSAAAGEGHLGVVKVLLAAGAEANRAGGRGSPPLLRAVEEGHLEVVKVLLAAGANVDLSDEDGRTPLLQAAWRGHSEVVELLLAAGANVHGTDKRPPLDRKDAIMFTSDTPLIAAADRGRLEIVRALLAAGAEPNRTMEPRRGEPKRYWETALTAASRQGHLEVVKLLLAAGATVDKPNCNGHTPLSWAASNCYKDVASVLLAAGAETDQVRTVGGDPDDYGEESGSYDRAKRFLQLLQEFQVATRGQETNRGLHNE